MRRTDRSDGGSAFPHTFDTHPEYQGMSLREYAAVHIAAAIVGLPSTVEGGRVFGHAAVAKMAVEATDYLLKELQK